MNSIYVKWRVQTKGPRGAWSNKGLFETRAEAREDAASWRNFFGFGNTRVIRKEVKR